MRIKGSDLKRIIREEISRVSGRRVIKEDAMPVDKTLLKAAADALDTDVMPGGLRLKSVGGTNLLSLYLSAWDRLGGTMSDPGGGLISQVVAALPPGERISGSILGGFNRFAKLGSQSPMAAELRDICSSSKSDSFKASAILATLAGFDYNLAGDRAGGSFLGIDPENRGGREDFDMSFGRFTVRKFVEAIQMMANFNLPENVEAAMGREAAPGRVEIP